MATSEKKAERSATAVARSYFEAVAARDLDAMEPHWDPAGVGVIHGIVELRQGDNYRSWFGDFFASFPDLVFEVVSITGSEDRAAVHWRARGTFNGATPFEGLDPNGESVDVQGIDLLEVQDGVIKNLDAFTNSAELMRQLGALPPAGSRQERAFLGALNMRTKIATRLGRG